ncbi:MAG: hypothetical protein QHH02_01580 [Syntrophomonadaceae bacterium]|nr:hypothetical protein [Syntrophomonadaceae bacterium]
MSLSTIFQSLKDAGRIKYFWEYERKIEPGYFYNPRGIHGVGHTRRVLLLSQILSVLSGLDDREQEFLAIVSLLHDIGRTNDDVDPEHGRISFCRSKELGLVDRFPGFSQEMIRFVVEMHCVGDKRAFKQVVDYRTDPDEALKMLSFFKDADGLDRVRIGDLDPDQLRTPAARRLVPFAEELFLNPEKVMSMLQMILAVRPIQF